MTKTFIKVNYFNYNQHQNVISIIKKRRGYLSCSLIYLFLVFVFIQLINFCHVFLSNEFIFAF